MPPKRFETFDQTKILQRLFCIRATSSRSRLAKTAQWPQILAEEHKNNVWLRPQWPLVLAKEDIIYVLLRPQWPLVLAEEDKNNV